MKASNQARCADQIVVASSGSSTQRAGRLGLERVRNVVIISLFCFLLLCPALVFLGQEKLQLDLPPWLTAEDADYLSGGLEEAHVLKYLNVRGFTSEKLQSNLETALNNHVPFKAAILLGNAALQRTAIASSNRIFGFDAIPTYYGSDKVYLPEMNALARMPDDEYDAVIEGTAKTAQGLAVLAAAYPAVDFCIVVADESNTSEANPASALVSERVTTEDCVAELDAYLDNISNVMVVSMPYEDTERYYREYYTTDHHWNGYGTLAVYDKIKTAMGFEDDRSNDCGTVEIPSLRTNGSCAREGLMFLNEPVREPQFDLSGLKVDNEKTPPLIASDPLDNLLELGPKAEFAFYSSWYGTYQLAAMSPIVNSNASSQSTAIVIQDSFNNSLHWLLAQNHERLECFSDTKPSDERHTLQERIDSAGADTVYLVGNVSAIRRLTDEQPDYFMLD